MELLGTFPSLSKGAWPTPKSQRYRWLGSLLLMCVLIRPGQGQIQKLTGAMAAQPTQPAQPVDPLGRSTPRGTLGGFIRAVHREDYVSAARFMQLSAKQRPNTEVLARDLKDLLDRYFSQPLTSVSDSPTGALDDGLPLDQEQVGPLVINGERTFIILARVTDPDAGEIWLISSPTLSEVPSLHESIQKTWVEQFMPAPLLEYFFLGISLAQWLLWILSIAIPLGSFWLLTNSFDFFLKPIIPDAARRRFVVSQWAKIRWPAIIVLTLVAHLVSIEFLGFSLTFRLIYVRSGLVLLVIALAWLIRRIASVSVEHARGMIQRRGGSGTESLLLLGHRLFDVLIVIVAIFAILTMVGIDTKTALTGLGIGGVAVALGAQKTVENLLGGIFLLTDNALAVGDVCNISNRVGTVEDITLRSVRLRTTEQTLLSIPAGILSQGNIENLKTRRKILVQTNLPLRYGTTSDQLRVILDGTRQLLSANPAVETQSARIRLVEFGVRAIQLELFAYILTADFSKFLEVREDLLLQIATLVESAGSAFASSTQFVYLKQDGDGATSVQGILDKGEDQPRSEAGEQAMQKHAS
jgi:MscS family membrane protein